MPSDALVTNSLAYRKSEADIIAGRVPEKYTRLLPFIPGERVLEIGSAEGVLSLLLARADQGNKKAVTALERRQERHEAALLLAMAWQRIYNLSAEIALINGGVCDHLHLLQGIDTLVAVRMIYYLGADLDRVFAEAARHVPNVVLCGNKNRAHWWREGLPNKNDRADNYYASAEGMRDVLQRHGYEIASECLDGDPIVVGRRG